MRLLVLGLAAVLTMMAAAPASAQFIYMDVNGDGQCTSSDVLSSSVTAIDIYIDTDTNADGSPATCPTGDPVEPLSMNSYTIVLQSTGGVTYGAWTDATGFTVAFGTGSDATDFWVGYGGSSYLPPGAPHKLGTVAVTVTGSPALRFSTSTPLSVEGVTLFGSECAGNVNFDNTLRLGTDFYDACVLGTFTPVTSTTWGKIKKIYTNK
jgi:hypothetical protein